MNFTITNRTDIIDNTAGLVEFEDGTFRVYFVKQGRVCLKANSQTASRTFAEMNLRKFSKGLREGEDLQATYC